jgi:precorrin-6A/cobalt-precorrin-6A reductase
VTLRLLLLAGSAEARAIARGLAALPGVAAIASLSGATRDPAPLPIPTRVGGFGGEAGFAAWLAAERIGAVIDATHPFAARITPRTARVCAELGVPHRLVQRPPWQPGPDDRWSVAADEAAAAQLVPPAATVFLATGGERADRFAGLRARRVFLRRIDPPDAPCPIPDATILVARPPFALVDEIALFDRLGIDWLVTRNAGGDSGRTKLEAGRQLGLGVVMIDRPALPRGLQPTDVAGALAWTAARAGG